MMLGLDMIAVKKKAPYIGAVVGGLLGLLAMAYTGKHGGSRWTGRALLPLLGKPVSAMVKNGTGLALGAAVGGGVGYVVKKKG